MKEIVKLVGCRFKDLQQIEEKLKELGIKNPYVYYSQSEITDYNEIDGTIDKSSDKDSDYFTLSYLRTRTDSLYITEVYFWV